MIIGLQVVAIIFSLVMIYFALLHFRRGEINGVEITSWIVIWTATLLVVVFPSFLRSFARNLFITRLFDMMVVGGFVLLISMVARAYVSTKRTEKKLEDLLRKDLLKNIKPIKRNRKPKK